MKKLFTTLFVACITFCGCDKGGEGLDPELPINLDIEITGPLLVNYGSTSTISCVAKLANQLTIKTTDGRIVVSGAQSANYTTPTLTDNTTYEVTASSGTTTAQKTVTIVVTPPEIILLLQAGKWRWSGLKTKTQGNPNYQTSSLSDSAKDDIYTFLPNKTYVVDFGALKTSPHGPQTSTANYRYYYLNGKLMLQKYGTSGDGDLCEVITCTSELLQLEVTTKDINYGLEVKILFEYTNVR